VRSIVDGHILLSRDLASRGHYPAIEVLGSISRCMSDVVAKEQVGIAHRFLDTLATYRRSEDLINIGAYAKGSNAKIDESIQMIDRINTFLRQPIMERASLDDSREDLLNIFDLTRRVASGRRAVDRVPREGEEG
jgi:flagellum-specific ATP synthase